MKVYNTYPYDLTTRITNYENDQLQTGHKFFTVRSKNIMPGFHTIGIYSTDSNEYIYTMVVWNTDSSFTLEYDRNYDKAKENACIRIDKLDNTIRERILSLGKNEKYYVTHVLNNEHLVDIYEKMLLSNANDAHKCFEVLLTMYDTMYDLINKHLVSNDTITEIGDLLNKMCELSDMFLSLYDIDNFYVGAKNSSIISHNEKLFWSIIFDKLKRSKVLLSTKTTFADVFSHLFKRDDEPRISIKMKSHYDRKSVDQKTLLQSFLAEIVEDEFIAKNEAIDQIKNFCESNYCL